jgi:hypothetical protein
MEMTHTRRVPAPVARVCLEAFMKEFRSRTGSRRVGERDRFLLSLPFIPPYPSVALNPAVQSNAFYPPCCRTADRRPPNELRLCVLHRNAPEIASVFRTGQVEHLPVRIAIFALGLRLAFGVNDSAVADSAVGFDFR